MQVQMPPEMHSALTDIAGPRQASVLVRRLIQAEIDRSKKKKQKRA